MGQQFMIAISGWFYDPIQLSGEHCILIGSTIQKNWIEQKPGYHFYLCIVQLTDKFNYENMFINYTFNILVFLFINDLAENMD